MLFVKIEDTSSSIELLVFPTLLKKTLEVWQEGKAVLCEGKISDKDQEVKLLVNRAAQLDLNNMSDSLKNFDSAPSTERRGGQWVNNNKKEYRPYYAQSNQATVSVNERLPNPLKIILNKGMDNGNLEKLKNVLIAAQGEEKVYFKIDDGNGGKIIETAFLVDNNQELVEKIKTEFNELVTVVN